MRAASAKFPSPNQRESDRGQLAPTNRPVDNPGMPKKSPRTRKNPKTHDACSVSPTAQKPCVRAAHSAKGTAAKCPTHNASPKLLCTPSAQNQPHRYQGVTERLELSAKRSVRAPLRVGPALGALAHIAQIGEHIKKALGL